MSDSDDNENVISAPFGGVLTPRQVILNAAKKTDGIKCVMVITMDDEDFVDCSWSSFPATSRFGMLEFAKIIMLDALFEEQEDEGEV